MKISDLIKDLKVLQKEYGKEVLIALSSDSKGNSYNLLGKGVLSINLVVTGNFGESEGCGEIKKEGVTYLVLYLKKHKTS